MSRPNWQKSFRHVPDAILARVSKIPGDEIMVSCVKKVSASELGSGTYGHLGLSIQGDRPVFPNRIVPEPAFGKFSLRNVHGEEIVRRDLPMVTKTFSAETPNWGDWSNGSHEISWDRDVYHARFHSAQGTGDFHRVADNGAGRESCFRFQVPRGRGSEQERR